jgi:mannose-6-phosphate isomerase
MTSSMLYPLLLERQPVYRMWGGQRISEWLDLPASHLDHVGETWEIFDTNPVRNGPLAGHTLAQVTQQHKESLVGLRMSARYGADFPLLLKFIDANEKLSIQVHPDDAYAHRNEGVTGFHGKTEAWYVLDARPGADIIYGLKDSMDRNGFVAAVESGTLEQQVQHVPVYAGDVILTPPGMLHAINAGIFLFEIQQKSDLTYRVYDYGRIDPSTGKQRTLHLDKALDVLSYIPSPVPKSKPLDLLPDQSRRLLVACKHFALEYWILSSECALVTNPDTLDLFTCIEGAMTVIWDRGEVLLKTGDTVILPAQLGEAALAPTMQPCTLLRVYVPDLEHDIIAPLREGGIEDERIAQVVFHL